MGRLLKMLNPRWATHREEVDSVARKLSLQEREAAARERTLRRLELELGVLHPNTMRDAH